MNKLVLSSAVAASILFTLGTGASAGDRHRRDYRDDRCGKSSYSRVYVGRPVYHAPRYYSSGYCRPSYPGYRSSYHYARPSRYYYGGYPTYYRAPRYCAPGFGISFSFSR